MSQPSGNAIKRPRHSSGITCKLDEHGKFRTLESSHDNAGAGDVRKRQKKVGACEGGPGRVCALRDS